MIHVENNKDSLILSYVDDKKQISFVNLNVPESERYQWVTCSEKEQYKDYTTWDKKPVKKKHIGLLNKVRTQEYLHFSISEEQKTRIFNYDNLPKMYFVDIETEIKYGFPDSKNPVNAITSISMVDEAGKCMVLGLKDLTNLEIQKIEDDIKQYLNGHDVDVVFDYKKFESEENMLSTFLAKFLRKFPCVTGWNFVDFDWSYISARCNFLGIDPSICSPTGTLDWYGFPKHKIIFDYLIELKDPSSGLSDKSSMRLDAVAENELKLKKVQYSGTLDELYANDFSKFIMYNAIDSYLVMLLDRKFKAFNTIYKLMELTHVEFGRTSPIPMWENLVLNYLFPKHIVSATENNGVKTKKTKKSIAGGYVKAPVTGFHKNIACYDYASLYPSIIRQFNISPDVYLGQSNQLDKEQINANIACESGAVFQKDKDGFYRTIITDVYMKRKYQKKLAHKIDIEIDRLQKLKNK